MMASSCRTTAWWRDRWLAIVTTACLAAFFALPSGSSAQSQLPQSGLPRRRVVPTDEYLTHFYRFYEGRYSDALRDFRRDGRRSIKTPTSRWIDSICYHTMTGESHYHMGQLAEALEHYTSALELFVAFSDWMIRVQFPDVIRPAAPGQVRPVPWGKSQRLAKLGRFRNTFLIGQGRINNQQQVQRGGVVQQPILYSIRVPEIVRCTTLAQRRRRELMGPLSEHDRLTKDISAVLGRSLGPRNHWASVWMDVQVGLAFAAENRNAQAKERLTNSLLAAGQFDHPLTATALLELGKISLAEGDLDSAGDYFEEATYSAFHFYDPGLLEEAFRYASLTHLLSNRRQIYAPLETAARWADVKDYRQLHASLVLSAAESYAALGQPSEASALLDKARQIIGRRDMRGGWMGARLNFLTARVRYQQGNAEIGDASLADALGYQRGGSLRLFQIALADRLYLSGQLSPRVMMKVYEQLLPDPRAEDWVFDPLDSLATLVTPHGRSIERWFEVALERRERERALEIADLARRHQFLTTLPLGGRLLGLRWILDAPLESLDQHMTLQRRDLLTRYGAYQELSREASRLRDDLRRMPPVIDDPADRRPQLELLGELERVSGAQEEILRHIAVGREGAQIAFPPRRTAQEIQQTLGETAAALVFFETEKTVYAMLLTNDRLEYWAIGTPVNVRKRVTALLKSLGQLDANRQLARSHLESDDWKKEAGRLSTLIWEKAPTSVSDSFDELVVVPDGSLWYVPFELLNARGVEEPQPLISKVRVRTLPTASLMVPQRRGRIPDASTAVVVGRLFPRDDQTVALAAYEQLSQVLPGATALVGNLPASSAIFGSLLDRVIVLDDVTDAMDGLYGWAPLRLDRGSPGSTLADWMRLPMAGPDQWILPGFHTGAENSMRRMRGDTAGQDLFLTVCGLMATGARTVLISRWRTGGATSFDLVREFAQELPHAAPADAWQRSVFLAMDSLVDPESEPRVERDRKEGRIKAAHPFFWSGYLLIDASAAIDEGEAPHPVEAVIPADS